MSLEHRQVIPARGRRAGVCSVGRELSVCVSLSRADLADCNENASTAPQVAGSMGLREGSLAKGKL